MLGGIDTQDYSLLTNPNEVSNAEDAQLGLSNAQLDRNLEAFKKDLLRQNVPSSQNQSPDQPDQVRDGAKDKHKTTNNFNPNTGLKQSNLGNMGEQRRTDGQAPRSTSNSARFSKKPRNANLIHSDTKLSHKMERNKGSYKTTEFGMRQTQETNQTKGPGHLQQSQMAQKGYDYDYNYQKPMYPVYQKPPQLTESGEYITPQFNSFQVQEMNNNMYKEAIPVMVNHSQMQMSLAPQHQNNVETTSMSTYLTQTNLGYYDENGHPYMMDPNIIYNQQDFESEDQNYENEEESTTQADSDMYKKWSKNKIMGMKRAKKFRPHSNNVRNFNKVGGGVWGVDRRFLRKFNQNRNLGTTSGLSKI